MRTLCNFLSVLILSAFAVMAAGSLQSEESTEAQVASQAPGLSVSARQLYSDYQSNGIAADQMYKDQTILVTGTVDMIGKDIMDTMYVTLIGDGVIGSVQCYFAKAHENELAGLRQGMSVSVKGRCDGKMINVMMKGCTLAR